MIRRETLTEDGQRRWILISQPDHARASGELAEAWGLLPLTKPAACEELLAAIYHHDDGWAAWEKTSQVDQRTGIPYEFTEMPLVDSLPIWRGSIAAAGSFGHLAAWVVAGHFSHLLLKASSWRKAGGELAALAQAFLDEQDQQRQFWLSHWTAADPEGHTLESAQQALRALQFFDALSLWFCCAERSAPHTVETPSGQRITFTPINPTSFVVQPWPLSVPELQLCISGRSVLATPYQSAVELAGADGMEVNWGWCLQPE